MISGAASGPFEPDRRGVLMAGIALPFGCLLRRRGTLAPDPVLLAGRLSTATREEAYALGVEAMRAGLSVAGLNGAVLLAALSDIPPRPMGGPLHAAMVVESAIQLTQRASERWRWIAALWCLGDYLDYRERVRSEAHWRWSTPPNPRFASAEQASAELVSALDEWDAERADRAITGLVEHRSAQAIFETLRPYSARCFGGLGHKLLYAVQLERVLERVDARIAAPALRSLVACLIHPDAERETASQERADELAAELPADWESGEEDAKAAIRLARSLRGRSAGEAQDLVAHALTEGLGPRSAWNGLRLLGTDLFLRRSSSARGRHLPVHTVTELNAFDSSSRRARDARVRARLLLQAPAWLLQLSSTVAELYGPLDEGEGIFDLERSGESNAPSSSLLRTATQDHHIKYAAAAIEEAGRAPEPFRQAVLHAGSGYLPEEEAASAPRYLLAVESLERSERG